MSGGSSKGSASYTVGYRYYLSMHMVVCHEADYLEVIHCGEKIAWQGNQVGGTSFNVNAYSLFGGESSEGGIGGPIDLLSGDSTQTQNSHLLSVAPSPQPAYRGVFSLVLKGFQIASINPYLKPWKLLINRYNNVWNTSYVKPLGTQVRWDNNKDSSTYHTWITETDVVTGMNPVHIIWEILTSNNGTARWGLKISTDDIDNTAFTAAAKTCYDEGFGLNILWKDDTSAEDLILDIMTYIDGILFVNPQTGLWTIKLFRGDYDTDDLTTVDEDMVVEIKNYVRTSYGELYNEIIVKWTQINIVDGEAETTRTCIVQNLANKSIQGGTVSKSISADYVTNSSVAQKLAERNLRQLSFPLASVDIVVTRAGSSILPGDVIKLYWPELGISNICFRVIKINYGELTDGKITLSCTEDVYGLGYSTFTGIGVSGWTNVDLSPTDSSYKRLEELPYYIAVNRYYEESKIDSLDEASGAICSYVAKPSSISLNYLLYEYKSSTSSYEEVSGCPFTPTGLITTSLIETTTSFSVVNISDISLISYGENGLAIIDDEIILIKTISYYDISSTTAIVTVARGVLDTTPTTHTINSRIWFIGLDDFGISTTIYLSGEVAKFKMCPRTSKGYITLDETTEYTKTLSHRMIRPYPIGCLKINNLQYPSSLSDDSAISITWNNRNRLTQTGYIVEQDAGNITPESGTTVVIKIYDYLTSSLIKTITGIDPTLQNYVYPLSDEYADRGPFYGDALTVKVTTQRNGYDSWQSFDMNAPTRTMSNGVLITEDGDYFVDESGNYLGY